MFIAKRLEWGDKTLKERMVAILVGEKDFVFVQMPVDVQLRIVPGQSALALRIIEFVAFVLKHGLVAKDRESMCEPLRDKELKVVVLGEFDGIILAIGRGVLADVDSHIKDRSFDYPDKFALSEGRFLEMESSEDAPFRLRLVVLDEMDV